MGSYGGYLYVSTCAPVASRRARRIGIKEVGAKGLLRGTGEGKQPFPDRFSSSLCLEEYHLPPQPIGHAASVSKLIRRTYKGKEPNGFFPLAKLTTCTVADRLRAGSCRRMK